MKIENNFLKIFSRQPSWIGKHPTPTFLSSKVMQWVKRRIQIQITERTNEQSNLNGNGYKVQWENNTM